MTEQILSRVNFTCTWCGGKFTFQPTLRGPDLGVRITVQASGGECMSHEARVVDLRWEVA